MDQTEKLYPDLVPHDETEATDNPAFLAACNATVSDLAAALGWRLGNSISTFSDAWGLVYRIDIYSKGTSPNSRALNRFICWGTADGEIVGTAFVCVQNGEPL